MPKTTNLHQNPSACQKYKITLPTGLVTFILPGHDLEQEVQFLAKAHLLQTTMNEMLLLETSNFTYI